MGISFLRYWVLCVQSLSWLSCTADSKKQVELWYALWQVFLLLMEDLKCRWCVGTCWMYYRHTRQCSIPLVMVGLLLAVVHPEISCKYTERKAFHLHRILMALIRELMHKLLSMNKKRKKRLKTELTAQNSMSQISLGSSIEMAAAFISLTSVTSQPVLARS